MSDTPKVIWSFDTCKSSKDDDYGKSLKLRAVVKELRFGIVTKVFFEQHNGKDAMGADVWIPYGVVPPEFINHAAMSLLSGLAPARA